MKWLNMMNVKLMFDFSVTLFLIFALLFRSFSAEMEKQFRASRPKVIFCSPEIYATTKQAALNTNSDIKIVCIKTAADESIPDGAIDFAQIIDINSKSVVVDFAGNRWIVQSVLRLISVSFAS